MMVRSRERRRKTWGQYIISIPYCVAIAWRPSLWSEQQVKCITCVCVVSGREERRRGKNFLSFQVEQRRVPKKKKKRGPAITLTHARTDITRPSLYAPDLFISKDARVCTATTRGRTDEAEEKRPTLLKKKKKKKVRDLFMRWNFYGETDNVATGRQDGKRQTMHVSSGAPFHVFSPLLSCIIHSKIADFLWRERKKISKII